MEKIKKNNFGFYQVYPAPNKKRLEKYYKENILIKIFPTNRYLNLKKKITISAYLQLKFLC